MARYKCVRTCYWRQQVYKPDDIVNAEAGDVPHHFIRIIDPAIFPRTVAVPADVVVDIVPDPVPAPIVNGEPPPSVSVAPPQPPKRRRGRPRKVKDDHGI